jgi:adenine-specific DNA-methyltransferase
MATFFVQGRSFNPDQAFVSDWQSVDFLFQLTDSEIQASAHGALVFDSKDSYDGSAIQSYLFFAIDLKRDLYSRTQLASITRAVNRLFDMPALLLFKHGDTITLSIIRRRLHKKDEAKDVLEKVTLIKDIRYADPHRAHIEIFYDLSFSALYDAHHFTNFVQLSNAWEKTLDISELNKRFYRELANWYFWAMDCVSFPDDVEKDRDIRNATSLIRLITRIIFIWFIKEKGLVPKVLFDRTALSSILKTFAKDKTSSNYYRAILQNLYFGTLNQKMDERGFAKEGSFPENRSNYGVKNLFRYADLFAVSEADALSLFQDIPFLNGGLFDCLDKENEEGKVLYADGFSRNPKKQALVPDFLFFGFEEEYDLNEVYGTKKKHYKVLGLIELLSQYKFTVAENTPIEEEVALDPELLGKAFENLLASYNPETKSTARKQTGSFYTPREIVDYMVDESLKAYMKGALVEEALMKEDDARAGLDLLFEYTEKEHLFDETETQALINAIDKCKILDPACGSGAFPMGVLHKMVHILHKLDPNNEQWKQRQIKKVDKLIEDAQGIPDSVMRGQVITGLEHNKQDIEDAFESNELDYGRKLYLIENCIYGVDIQPIAVQIAKLRFFISLIIDQRKQPDKENFGIRSLPNLETKFVAANTLIGLEKPKQMTIKNPEIDKLENDIRGLRHKYFSARTRREKLDCQKRDKTIRQKITQLLVNDGWGSATAQQIVQFDPYDQNASAPFFDPEWMFGIMDGFDVVIGNPPYVLLQDANRDEKLVGYFRNNFVVASFKVDLYHLFIEVGVRLLNNGGCISYITPSNYATNNYAVPLRRFMLTKTALRNLVFFEDDVFEASVNNTVFVALKSPANHTVFYNSNLKDNIMSIEPRARVMQSDLINEMCLLVPPENSGSVLVLKRIEKVTVRLGNIASVNFGMQLRDRKQFPDDVVECPTDKFRLTEYHRQCYTGKDIQRYAVSFNNRYCFFDRVAQCGGCWNEKVHNTKNKILIRQIGSFPEGGLDQKGYAVLNTAFMVVPNQRHMDSKFLLAIINSNIVRFYWSNKFKDNRKTFPKIKGEYLKLIPIPDVLDEQKDSIIGLVDSILYSKLRDMDAHTIFFEHLIDAMVYELYFPEEIKSACCEIFKYLTDLHAINESWSNDQKLAVIEKIYLVLSDPTHLVSIAMKKMLDIPEIQIIEGRQ